MKYLYALLVVCLLFVGAVGCASPADAPGTDGDVTAVKLASHNAVIEGNSYRVRYEADIQDAAAAAIDNGFDVSYASFVSNWDPATESQQLENSINEGYDILLVNPVAPTGLDPIIMAAVAADDPVGYGEAKPRARSLLFPLEKWLEGSIERFFVHTNSVVENTQSEIFSRCKIDTARQVTRL